MRKTALLFFCFISYFANGQDSCPEPVDLEAMDVTTNSANISWEDESGAAEWQIEWGEGGFSLGEGNLIVTDSNPYSLTDLMWDQDYDFYVRSICAEGDTSDWSGLGNFETLVPDDIGLTESKITILQLYPNPANNVLNLKFNTPIDHGIIEIFTITGQKVMSQRLESSSKTEVDLKGLHSGFYILKISSENNILVHSFQKS
ncbi:MAG: T9SS type A sorting domain-containing protein [Flavobacteriales bacterium]|nr:T9SS type A sorting domain-containing protein [Flavobacteriales bacterium]